MPRYHFHLETGATVPDLVGEDLAGLDAARICAVKSLAEIMNEHRERFWVNQPVRVTVTDHTGLTLFILEAAATEAPVLRQAGF